MDFRYPPDAEAFRRELRAWLDASFTDEYRSMKSVLACQPGDPDLARNRAWNALGQVSNWCELLVRTDPDAPKHKGISCLLVDMTLPGIEVRPLMTMTGEGEFNEIFFTDVRVPASALLGAENEGWRVAITTLAHERAGVANLHLGLRAQIRALLDLAKTTPF